MTTILTIIIGLVIAYIGACVIMSVIAAASGMAYREADRMHQKGP